MWLAGGLPRRAAPAPAATEAEASAHIAMASKHSRLGTNKTSELRCTCKNRALTMSAKLV